MRQQLRKCVFGSMMVSVIRTTSAFANPTARQVDGKWHAMQFFLIQVSGIDLKAAAVAVIPHVLMLVFPKINTSGAPSAMMFSIGTG
jgi:hypothetical protein